MSQLNESIFRLLKSKLHTDRHCHQISLDQLQDNTPLRPTSKQQSHTTWLHHECRLRCQTWALPYRTYQSVLCGEDLSRHTLTSPSSSIFVFLNHTYAHTHSLTNTPHAHTDTHTLFGLEWDSLRVHPRPSTLMFIYAGVNKPCRRLVSAETLQRNGPCHQTANGEEQTHPPLR